MSPSHPKYYTTIFLYKILHKNFLVHIHFNILIPQYFCIRSFTRTHCHRRTPNTIQQYFCIRLLQETHCHRRTQISYTTIFLYKILHKNFLVHIPFNILIPQYFCIRSFTRTSWYTFLSNILIQQYFCIRSWVSGASEASRPGGIHKHTVLVVLRKNMYQEVLGTHSFPISYTTIFL